MAHDHGIERDHFVPVISSHSWPITGGSMSGTVLCYQESYYISPVTTLVTWLLSDLPVYPREHLGWASSQGCWDQISKRVELKAEKVVKVCFVIYQPSQGKWWETCWRNLKWYCPNRKTHKYMETNHHIQLEGKKRNPQGNDFRKKSKQNVGQGESSAGREIVTASACVT